MTREREKDERMFTKVEISQIWKLAETDRSHEGKSHHEENLPNDGPEKGLT